MSVYLLRAPAKLNLYLRVFDKTEDGYHEIESLTQTIDLSDYLEVEFTKGVGIKVNVTSGSFNVNPEANTLIRTYEVLEEEYGEIDFGLVVKLHKRIPIGGGLGGGSSDAAALLRFLRGVLGISMDETLRVAFKVGSDVPALLFGGTVLVRGRGEIVEQLEPLPRYGVFLNCPEFPVDTRQAYLWLDETRIEFPSHTAMDCYEALKRGDFGLVWNDFRSVISRKVPPVEKALKELEKQHGRAFLTGSGSCVFSLSVSHSDHSFLPRFDIT